MPQIVKLVRDGGRWAPVLGADSDDLARELLARPEGYLVDDTAGQPLGVVDEVERHEHGYVLVVAGGGWRPGERMLVSTADVVEIHPTDQRLVVARGAAHAA